jgi:hypothetical protein
LKEKLSSQEGLTATEKADMLHQVEVLQRKIELELTNQSTVGNINDSAYLKSTKPVEKAKQAPV